ncbi:MAG: hypothetical protein E6772_13330 [Dysgonomonas sp.]|nr:hypothetical protein [Dysgonomonas sp.]
MRLHLILLLPAFLLSSCASTYFYSTISTLNEDMYQNEDGDFIMEEDSLLVAYWFSGRNAPVYINVYNKSGSPLYVDWASSSIIVDNVANSYNGNIYDIDREPEESSSQNIYIDGNSVIVNSYTDHTVEPEQVSFIPPYSRSTFNTMHLANFDYENLKGKYFKNVKLGSKSGEIVPAKMIKFTEESTPLRFRSYLTLYRDKEAPFPIEHEFYISNLIKTKHVKPNNLPDNLFNKGNMFYIEKESKNKGFGEALLGTTLVLGLFVIDAAITSSYHDDEY